MTLVPPKRVCFDADFGSYTSVSTFGSEVFITGIDSPVKIASLMIADPANRTRSQGNITLSGILITSPGTSYSELISTKP
jgi:hypothetical protein